MAGNQVNGVVIYQKQLRQNTMHGCFFMYCGWHISNNKQKGNRSNVM